MNTGQLFMTLDNRNLQFARVAITKQEISEKTLQRAVLIVSLTLLTERDGDGDVGKLDEPRGSARWMDESKGNKWHGNDPRLTGADSAG